VCVCLCLCVRARLLTKQRVFGSFDSKVQNGEKWEDHPYVTTENITDAELKSLITSKNVLARHMEALKGETKILNEENSRLKRDAETERRDASYHRLEAERLRKQLENKQREIEQLESDYNKEFLAQSTRRVSFSSSPESPASASAERRSALQAAAAAAAPLPLVIGGPTHKRKMSMANIANTVANKKGNKMMRRTAPPTLSSAAPPATFHNGKTMVKLSHDPADRKKVTL
jgi:hypothetical protein